MNFKTPKI